MRRTILFSIASFAALSAMAGAQAPPANATQKAQLAKLATLEKNYLNSKKAFTKTPKDKKVREAYIKNAVIFGHESMISPALGTSVKYKQALRVYREVLKLEPKHPVARPEHDLIVNIYKQMGRPVPK